jgi:hypothetical protein
VPYEPVPYEPVPYGAGMHDAVPYQPVAYDPAPYGSAVRRLPRRAHRPRGYDPLTDTGRHHRLAPAGW